MFAITARYITGEGVGEGRNFIGLLTLFLSRTAIVVDRRCSVADELKDTRQRQLTAAHIKNLGLVPDAEYTYTLRRQTRTAYGCMKWVGFHKTTQHIIGHFADDMDVSTLQGVGQSLCLRAWGAA